MQENRLEPPAHASRGSQKPLILWILFLGIALSFWCRIFGYAVRVRPAIIHAVLLRGIKAADAIENPDFCMTRKTTNEPVR